MDTYDDPRDKNLCRHCHKMVKMTIGQRTCTHYCASRKYAIGVDPEQKILCITNENDQFLAQVACIRGYENHINGGGGALDRLWRR